LSFGGITVDELIFRFWVKLVNLELTDVSIVEMIDEVVRTVRIGVTSVLSF